MPWSVSFGNYFTTLWNRAKIIKKGRAEHFDIFAYLFFFHFLSICSSCNQATQDWGLPLPETLPTAPSMTKIPPPRRHRHRSSSNLQQRSAVTGDDSENVAIALFCGEHCEYGLVTDVRRLRPMAVSDMVPTNSGMGARRLQSLRVAVQEARELLKGAIQDDDDVSSSSSSSVMIKIATILSDKKLRDKSRERSQEESKYI